MAAPPLLAVPNVSEGRDAEVIGSLGDAFLAGGAVRLLDVHSDRDHHRSVFTLAGAQGALAESLLAGARAVVERVDVMSERSLSGQAPGQHPFVGALDVVPLVYLDDAGRGAAFAEALVVGDRLGEELEIPVFLYGELSASGAGAGADVGSEGGERPRTRAELRRGGVAGLAARMSGASVNG